MLSIVKSMSLIGLEGYLINVQVDISAGIPSWEIVGLPDTSVKEAKERVRTAIKNSGYEMNSRKIIVNLAPADTKKKVPEFNKNTLEVLRGPLEDGIVTISRVNATLTYPCNFMFVASMNPCPCGFYGSKEKECTCSENAISKYMGKISGPLLDRIDIQIEVTPVKYQKLNNNSKEESSEEIKLRVNKARKIQHERYINDGIYSNSQLTPKLIEKYCKLDSQSKELLENAFKKLGLSARAYTRILKVSRTIADLAGSVNIQKAHIAEAIQYRSLDKKYWKN